MAEELVNGVVQRQYTYGRQRISESQVINNVWTPSFFGYDGAGSVRLLTNAAGTVTDTYEFDAFGNELNHTGTTPNNYLYRAEQYDPDLGFYYLRARWYSPVTGRFLSRDPANGSAANPASLHKYLYANGDPVDKLDPTGRNTLTEDALLRLTVAASTVVLYVDLKCLADEVGSALGYSYPGMWCSVGSVGGAGAGSGGGSGGRPGPGPKPAPVPEPMPTPPPPPIGPPPGCESAPDGCAGSSGGNLANAQEIAQQIAKNYGSFQCEGCAGALAEAFSEAGYEGEFLDVNTQVYRYGGLTYDGQVISTNGFHEAVVLDIGGEQYVFDQFANGVPLEEWKAGLNSGFPIEYTPKPWPQ